MKSKKTDFDTEIKKAAKRAQTKLIDASIENNFHNKIREIVETEMTDLVLEVTEHWY